MKKIIKIRQMVKCMLITAWLFWIFNWKFFIQVSYGDTADQWRLHLECWFWFEISAHCPYDSVYEFPLRCVRDFAAFFPPSLHSYIFIWVKRKCKRIFETNSISSRSIYTCKTHMWYRLISIFITLCWYVSFKSETNWHVSI